MPDLAKYIGLHPPDENHVIAFEDLVQYVADVGLENLDVHFKTVDQLCGTCDFPYQYVLKSETSPEDSWFVTDKMNVTLSDFTRHVPALESDFPSYSEPTRKSAAQTDEAARLRHAEEAKVISRLFRHVPRATIRILMALYASDFAAFGYTFNASTLEIGGYQ